MSYTTLTQRVSDFFPANLNKTEANYFNYAFPSDVYASANRDGNGSKTYNSIDGLAINYFDGFSYSEKGAYLKYVQMLDNIYYSSSYRYNVVLGYNNLRNIAGNYNIYLGTNTAPNSLTTSNTVSIGHNITPINDYVILKPNPNKGQIYFIPPRNISEICVFDIFGNNNITYSSSTVFIRNSRLNINSSKLSLSAMTIAIGNSAVSDRDGMYSVMHNGFSVAGDSQKSDFILRGTTSSYSFSELFTDGISKRMTIPSGKFWSGTVNVLGIRDNGQNCARYMRQVTIGNVGGNVSVFGNVSTIGQDLSASKVLSLVTYYTDVNITADNSNDSLSISVRGLPSETMRWIVSAEGVELVY